MLVVYGTGEIPVNTLKFTYCYDANDQLVEMVDYKVTGNIDIAYHYTKYSYDSRGRMTGAAEISQTS